MYPVNVGGMELLRNHVSENRQSSGGTLKLDSNTSITFCFLSRLQQFKCNTERQSLEFAIELLNSDKVTVLQLSSKYNSSSMLSIKTLKPENGKFGDVMVELVQFGDVGYRNCGSVKLFDVQLVEFRPYAK